MAQFPRFLMPQTPGGLTPVPFQVRALDLTPALVALSEKAPKTTKASTDGTSKSKKDDDLELKGRIGAVDQYMHYVRENENKMANLMGLYGPTVAAQMPEMTRLRQEMDKSTQLDVLNRIERETKQQEDYKKYVDANKIGQLFNLEQAQKAGFRKGSIKRNNQWVQDLEQTWSRQLPNGQDADLYGRGYGMEWDTDFALTPNTYDMEAARQAVDEIYKTGKTDWSAQNVSEGIVGASLGIMTKGSSGGNNFQQLEEAHQQAKERGMTVGNLEDKIASGYLQGFFQKMDAEGKLDQYYDEGDTMSEKMQRKFIEDYQKFVMEDLTRHRDKRKVSESKTWENFNPYDEHWAKAAGAAMEIEDFDAMSVAFESVMPDLIDAGFTPENYAQAASDLIPTAQSAASALQEIGIRGMADGLKKEDVQKLNDHGYFLKNGEWVYDRGASKAKTEKEDLMIGRNIVGQQRGKLSERMFRELENEGLVDVTIGQDGKKMYKIRPDHMTTDAYYKSIDKVLDKMTKNGEFSSVAQRNFAYKELTALHKGVKELANKKGNEVIGASTYMAHQVPATPEVNKTFDGIFKMVGDFNQAGNLLANMPWSPDGGKTWIDGRALQGTAGRIVGFDSGIDFLNAAGATNFRQVNGKWGFFDANGNPENPQYQSSSQNGWLLSVSGETERNYRQAAVQRSDDRQAFAYTPHAPAKKVQVAFNTEAEAAKALKGVTMRQTVSYPAYKKSDLGDWWDKARDIATSETGMRLLTAGQSDLIGNKILYSTIQAVVNDKSKSSEEKTLIVASVLKDADAKKRNTRLGTQKMNATLVTVPLSDGNTLTDAGKSAMNAKQVSLPGKDGKMQNQFVVNMHMDGRAVVGSMAAQNDRVATAFGGFLREQSPASQSQNYKGNVDANSPQRAPLLISPNNIR